MNHIANYIYYKMIWIELLLQNIRWYIRGVTTDMDFVTPCLRCNKRGINHWHIDGCIRFKG